MSSSYSEYGLVMAKMWQGRFKKELNEKVNDFNSSISFDSRMYRQDIQGSIIHVKMLGKQGVIDEKDSKIIAKELAAIYDDLESGELRFDMNAEDVHMFIEQVLTQRLGDLGKKLHTARSRNDQVAVDLRMYLRGEIDVIVGLIKKLIAVLVEKAEANLNTVMPGYTHLQRAQPITFAHHLMAYVEMFKRDMVRLFNCFLLRHYARTCGIRVVKLNEFKFPTAPHHDFFGQSGHMHHTGGDSACQFYAVISVAHAEAIFDSVDTVKLCLSTLAPMLATMTVNVENI